MKKKKEKIKHEHDKHHKHYDKVVHCFNGASGKSIAYCQQCGKEFKI